MSLFSYDNTVIIECTDIKHHDYHIKVTLSLIIEWMTINNLIMNFNKINLIQFSQRLAQQNINISFGNI